MFILVWLLIIFLDIFRFLVSPVFVLPRRILQPAQDSKELVSILLNKKEPIASCKGSYVFKVRDSDAQKNAPNYLTQTTSTNATSKVRRVASMTWQLGHMRSQEASCKRGAWSILHLNDRSIKHPAKKELWASCDKGALSILRIKQPPAKPASEPTWRLFIFSPALTEPSLPHYVTLAPVKLFLNTGRHYLPWKKCLIACNMFKVHKQMTMTQVFVLQHTTF